MVTVRRLVIIVFFLSTVLFAFTQLMDRILFLQDSVTKELFRVQGLGAVGLKFQTLLAGYRLQIEEVPFPVEDESWMVESLAERITDEMKLVIVSPFLRQYIQDVLAITEGDVLYLGAMSSYSSNNVLVDERVWGINILPDLNDRRFLSFMNDERFSKTVVYDPSFFTSPDIMDLRQNISDVRFISRTNFDSTVQFEQTVRKLRRDAVDYLVLLLSPVDIKNIIEIINVTSTTSPQAGIISTVIPIAGVVIGGFPFEYRQVFSQVLQAPFLKSSGSHVSIKEAETDGVMSESEGGNNAEDRIITVTIRFSLPPSLPRLRIARSEKTPDAPRSTE